MSLGKRFLGRMKKIKKDRKIPRLDAVYELDGDTLIFCEIVMIEHNFAFILILHLYYRPAYFLRIILEKACGHLFYIVIMSIQCISFWFC